jgi:hypothetical protein
VASPAVRVAARRQGAVGEDVEAQLRTIAEGRPSYARRDAGFVLADLQWRSGRREEAAQAYRRLAVETTSVTVRRFCERRSG